MYRVLSATLLYYTYMHSVLKCCVRPTDANFGTVDKLIIKFQHVSCFKALKKLREQTTFMCHLPGKCSTSSCGPLIRLHSKVLAGCVGAL